MLLHSSLFALALSAGIRSAPCIRSAPYASVRPRADLHARAAVDEVCDLEQVTCSYDPEEIDARFADEPLAVAARIADVSLAFARVKLADDDGATLRAELSRLGPVFCKVGQTLATRPDIIGLETSRNLGQLQDAIAPESGGAEVAMSTLVDAVGEISSRFSDITDAPIAAASLAEVYRATTVDGQAVAVKIQRPGLERKVALDLHVMRRLLALAQTTFNIGGDVGVVVAVLDEVRRSAPPRPLPPPGRRRPYATARVRPRASLQVGVGPSRELSPCCPVTLLPYHPAALSPCCPVTLLPCHPAALSPRCRWAPVFSESSTFPPRRRTSSASRGCTARGWSSWGCSCPPFARSSRPPGCSSPAGSTGCHRGSFRQTRGRSSRRRRCAAWRCS